MVFFEVHAANFIAMLCCVVLCIQFWSCPICMQAPSRLIPVFGYDWCGYAWDEREKLSKPPNVRGMRACSNGGTEGWAGLWAIVPTKEKRPEDTTSKQQALLLCICAQHWPQHMH
nr:hypothetical transcript [Hymenolepis microstoma]